MELAVVAAEDLVLEVKVSNQEVIVVEEAVTEVEEEEVALQEVAEELD